MNLQHCDVIAQDRAHDKTSSRYSFIPTSRVLSVLSDYGYEPTKIQKAGTRIEENKGFQKHIVRLRHRELPAILDGVFPEIVLINSHLGSASFQLKLGVFRLVCTNGMITGSEYLSHCVRHTGYADSAVEDAIRAITADTSRLTEAVKSWQSLILTEEESRVYAESAIEVAYDDPRSVTPSQVLKIHRVQDNRPDLWTTFNRVQENVIKGGIRAVNETGQRRRTRAIKSVDRDIKLNSALWSLAERMAELKQAH